MCGNGVVSCDQETSLDEFEQLIYEFLPSMLLNGFSIRDAVDVALAYKLRGVA